MILMLNTGLTDVNYTTLLYSILCLLLMAMESFLILKLHFCIKLSDFVLGFCSFLLCLFSYFILHTNFVILLHVYCRHGTAHMFEQTVK